MRDIFRATCRRKRRSATGDESFALRSKNTNAKGARNIRLHGAVKKPIRPRPLPCANERQHIVRQRDEKFSTADGAASVSTPCKLEKTPPCPAKRLSRSCDYGALYSRTSGQAAVHPGRKKTHSKTPHIECLSPISPSSFLLSHVERYSHNVDRH